eukprot:c9690_g1_i2.p1 GENE.c9690_g1_i2~~c9690_g1_i2.p1  ORF type:complete len:416 (-),score=133.75 c9690_g1_i2:106-1353(-)
MIKDEFSGDLENALVALLSPSPAHYYAVSIRKAMQGVGVNEAVIIRTLAGNDKKFASDIAEAYFKAYDARLIDSLKDELSGSLKKAAVTWISKAEPDRSADGSQLVVALSKAIAERDADEIHAACKGWGTDESRIVSVVCSRTKSHLLEVDLAHRDKYKSTLANLLSSEISGDFKKLIKYIIMPEVVFDVYIIDKATKGFGTNEALFIEALASRSPARVTRARAKFEARGRPLVDKVNSELSGELKKIALLLLDGRPETPADESLAEQQAEELHEAGVGQWGTNEEKFISVLGTSSVAQCQAIRKAYEAKFQASLDSAIRTEFSGDLEQALLALLLTPVEYACVRLRRATTGFGVNESTVARMLGGNDKAFLKEVADTFFAKYDTRLIDVLLKKLSGEFKRAAVAWVNNPAFGDN